MNNVFNLFAKTHDMRGVQSEIYEKNGYLYEKDGDEFIPIGMKASEVVVFGAGGGGGVAKCSGNSAGGGGGSTSEQLAGEGLQ